MNLATAHTLSLHSPVTTSCCC